MQDVMDAGERRMTVALALLVVAMMLIPVRVSAQATPVDRPTDRAIQTTASPTPTGSPTPTETPTASPTPSDSATPPAVPAASPTPTESEGADIPVLPIWAPTEPANPSPSPSSGGVTAEGSDAEEVVAPPAAPQPDPRPTDVAAAGDQPSPAPTGEAGVEPPPITAYGPAVVPSLGTATAPLTNEMTGFDGTAPLVLAPQIAGQQVQPNGPSTASGTTEQGFAGAVDPVRDVAAATLSIVQPSWYATTVALLVLLAVASYGAVLRRRGEDLPEALSVTSAIRPHDAAAHHARSVRPADLRRQNPRSIRP